MKFNIPLDKWFSDVLKWNVMFGVPVPDYDNLPRMLALVQEEFTEYQVATSKEQQVDAIADMIVVTLGMAARLLVRPVRTNTIIKRAGSGAKNIRLDRYSLQGVNDAITGNCDIALAINEFLELLFIHCENADIDIAPEFEKVMIANWTKFWSEEELKKKPINYTSQRVGGIVVKNENGKIMKPPTFKHP